MNRLAPLMAEALAARNTRDVETAEAAAAEALAKQQHDEAAYEVRARVAQNAAREILGEHADGIRWSRWRDTPQPYGTHPDLPPRIVLTDDAQPGDPRGDRVLVLAIVPGVRTDGGAQGTELLARAVFDDLAGLADGVEIIEKEIGG